MKRKIIIALLIIGFVSCITLYTHLNESFAEPNKKIETEEHKRLVKLISSWRTLPHFSGFNVTSSEISYNYKGFSSAKECYYDGDRYIFAIYGGTEPPVDFGDMGNYKNDWDKRCGSEDWCQNSPDMVARNITIKKPKNVKTKDFFQDVLRFYRDKGYIKNIDKPSGIGYEDTGARLTYDFKKAGVYGQLHIDYTPEDLGPAGYPDGDVKISDLYFLKDKHCWLRLFFEEGMSDEKLSMPIWERWKY